MYRIVVHGALNKSWTDRLAGMAITAIQLPEQKPRSTLRGWIRDQAQLMGVLDTLYELHLPILAVEKLEDQPPTQEERQEGDEK